MIFQLNNMIPKDSKFCVIKRCEFKYEITFSACICNFVNHTFKTEFVIFDIWLDARLDRSELTLI